MDSITINLADGTSQQFFSQDFVNKSVDQAVANAHQTFLENHGIVEAPVEETTGNTVVEPMTVEPDTTPETASDA